MPSSDVSIVNQFQTDSSSHVMGIILLFELY